MSGIQKSISKYTSLAGENSNRCNILGKVSLVHDTRKITGPNQVNETRVLGAKPGDVFFFCFALQFFSDLWEIHFLLQQDKLRFYFFSFLLS